MRERIQPVAVRDGGDHHPCGRVLRWTAVQTHPQAERWADANLRRLGYRTYLPIVGVKRMDRVTRSMTRIVPVPLFPGYLFLALGPTDPWTPVRYSPGVRKLLVADGQVVYARAGAVEAVQAAVAEGATQPSERARWASGDAVSLLAGPFREQAAVVLRVEGEEALVALMMLGHLREVRVRLAALGQRVDG